MRHWSQLGTRNWRAKPGRTALGVAAIALGSSAVVWVTGCYDSVRRTMTATVLEWIGRSHVTVEHLGGRWGLFDERLAAKVAELPNVAAVAARCVELVHARRDGTPPADAARFDEFDVTGIQADRERLFRSYDLVSGRWPHPGERGVVLAETWFIQSWGLHLDDQMLIAKDANAPARPFRVIGFVGRRRASAAQWPMFWCDLRDAQEVTGTLGKIKSLDVILRDPAGDAIRRAVADIGRLADQLYDDHRQVLKVSTTEAQLAKLRSAQALVEFILILSAAVLLLTAFFIIVATMNMGVTERIRHIGLLRCVGVSRAQAAASVFIESVPIGLLGVALGVPLGRLLQLGTLQLAPQYLGTIDLTAAGVLAAVVGGVLTAAAAAALPAVRALTVSPVEATRPLAHPARAIWLVAAAAVGAALVVAPTLLLRRVDAADFGLGAIGLTCIGLLYAGHALCVPAGIVLLGAPLVRVVGAMLGLRPQLLGDEVHRSPWRAAAICSGLMVGLSLIVGLAVWSESVRAGWQFPREFPEVLVYAWRPVPLETARRAAGVPGTRDMVVADEFKVSFEKPSAPDGNFISRLTTYINPGKDSRFVAVEPEHLSRIISLAYLEGSPTDAVRRMRQGGCVLITRELSMAQNKHLEDEIDVYYDSAHRRFRVVGVVAAPAVDIAMSFFNATEWFQFYAVGTVFGSLDDVARHFGRRDANILVFNFDRTHPDLKHEAEQEVVPPAPSVDLPAMRPATRRYQHPGLNPEAEGFMGTPAERAIIDRVVERLGPDVPVASATAAQLKRRIESSLYRVLLLLSAIPTIGMLIAAAGVGNLMMANVTARRREIAILRAIGTTRGQVARMVIGEALILGLLGSAAGLALGIHLGDLSNTLTQRLAGYQPEFQMPWLMLATGAAVATALCTAAGLLPARYAAKENVVAALQA